MSAEELADDPRPDLCLEISPTPRQSGDDVTQLRLTPLDLVRLQMEADQALAEIRAAATEAEAVWWRSVAAWHAEGRAAVAARDPDVDLLRRLLVALRRTTTPLPDPQISARPIDRQSAPGGER
ncbi:hypothetical protein [Streptomyces sp. SID12501]|uniref:Uncharacterized protein n=1 Tax=Streptomyces sp. SID12501 TaxID=2706042 RepID=A0A6B3C2U5_9ACTN|nr:hypothetical protein [Streptomyces sp. SID12501]NEC90938.1 hypothetical protein [Streptomyces sp. SID12501]